MSKKRITPFVLSLLILTGFTIQGIHAQVIDEKYMSSTKDTVKRSKVALLAGPRIDSILLRWAPTDPNTWRLGNEYGYVVKRYTVLRDKKIPKEITETLLTPQPLKPKPIEVWEPFADEKYVAIAGECIYGSVFGDIPAAGNPFIAYKKYQEEIHRFSFALYAADQSIRAAELSGLYFADKTAQSDEKYLYRVYINCPDSLATDTAYFFTGLSEYQPLPKPLDLKAEWGDHEVGLSWNIFYLNHIYNSYILEKSFDQGKTYTQIGDGAIVQLADEGVSPGYMFKSDTLEDNNTQVYYRVRGISAFGEMGPPSDSVFGYGKIPISIPPVITMYYNIDNKYIRLLWEFPEKMNKSVTGFKIYRSPGPEGRKTVVYHGTDPERREFIDSTAGFTNYYLISVYNESTERLSSILTYAERVDSFPPMPPQHVTGLIDTTGKITIRWSSNHDEDLEGYRVYMSNHPDYEFLLITPAVIADTVFNDSITLKTLTRNIYYKIKAVDVRQNQSQFSDMLTIEKPDIIAPVSPVIKNITDVNGRPEIMWVNSSSDDVQFHHIYRKTKSDTVYQVLVELEKTTEVSSSYLDKKVEPGKEYTYYIAAVDEGGLLSEPSNIGYFKTASDITEGVKLKKKEYADHVELSWVVTSDKTVERILIYRSIGEEDMRLYDNSQTGEFTDPKLSPEKTYNYCARAVYTDGSSSELSNTVTIKL